MVICSLRLACTSSHINIRIDIFQHSIYFCRFDTFVDWIKASFWNISKAAQTLKLHIVVVPCLFAIHQIQENIAFKRNFKNHKLLRCSINRTMFWKRTKLPYLALSLPKEFSTTVKYTVYCILKLNEKYDCFRIPVTVTSASISFCLNIKTSHAWFVTVGIKCRFSFVKISISVFYFHHAVCSFNQLKIRRTTFKCLVDPIKSLSSTRSLVQLNYISYGIYTCL